VDVVFGHSVRGDELLTLCSDLCAHSYHISVWKVLDMSSGHVAHQSILPLKETLLLKGIHVKLEHLGGVSHSNKGLAIRHQEWHNPVVIQIF
jgi:hypothetical protein